MLASLLRWTILAQVMAGGWLGYALADSIQVPWLGAVLMGFAMPFALLLVTITVSALLTRASEEPAHLWWRSLVGELIASITVFIFRQPWSFARPALQPAASTITRIPVVLVHGYLCNHRIWDDVGQRLRAQGHAVYAIDLEPLLGSIDNYAAAVETAVQALLAHTGQAKVALVGHSMGGLAIRAWMRAQGSHRVARVLTLGTPHVGTALARAAHTVNGRQMQWHSAWLTTLAAQENTTTHALLRIAITPQDNIVSPQRAQVVADIHPTVFEGIGHVQMCLHRPVIDWIAQQLADLGP